MAWFRRSVQFAIFVGILALLLAVNIPKLVQAQLPPSSLSSTLENAFRTPPGSDGAVAANIEGGDCRCSCVKGDKPLIALVPASGIGQTVAEYPTLIWYMPDLWPEHTVSPTVEFVLRDANKQEVYSVKYELEKLGEEFMSPGIKSVTVASPQPLEIGQDYYWELVLKCNSTDFDHSGDIFVEGKIKRVELDPTIAARLQQANPEARIVLYAEQGGWYETLATLVELRRDRPNDTNLADAWDKLLTSVGLDIISEEKVN